LADVVIVGGGIVGLSIAWSLIQEGSRSVVVIERRHCGEGSTGKATGGVRCQFSTEVNVRLTLASLPHFRAWKETHGADVGYRPVGYVFIAASLRHLEIQARAVAMQRACGARVLSLRPDDLISLLPGVELEDAVGGSLGVDDGLADPGVAVSSLVSSCQRRGVRIEEQTEVVRVTVADSRVTGVETSVGLLEAATVVIAGGPWSRALLEGTGFDVPITPKHRQVYRAVGVLGLPPQCPFVVDLESGIYFHHDNSGLIFGGGDRDGRIGFDENFNMEDASSVIEALCRRVPQAATASLAGGWAGIRDMTPDDVGIIGWVPTVSGLMVAAGFSGHGFMHAPAVGEQVARMIRGEQCQFGVDALAPARFGASTKGEDYVF
jgi:sarcosine oxidase, subunit beta